MATRRLAQAPAPKPIRVTVRTDPRRKAAYDSLHAQMLTASRTEARGFDAFWEAVGEILDGELYVSGGYETPADFVRAEVKLSLRQTQRWVRVARLASPAEEDRWGSTLLDAAIAYVEARAGGPVKGALPVKFASLRIPVKVDGKVRRLGLDALDVATVRKATAALRKGKSAHGNTASPAEETLRAALGNVRGLGASTVHVSDGKVKLGEIPLYALADLGRALVALSGTLGTPAAATSAAPSKRRPARK